MYQHYLQNSITNNLDELVLPWDDGRPGIDLVLPRYGRREGLDEGHGNEKVFPLLLVVGRRGRRQGLDMPVLIVRHLLVELLVYNLRL